VQTSTNQIDATGAALNPQSVADAMRRARVLRAEAFMQLCVVVPVRWLRSRIDAARRSAGAPVASGT